MSYEKHQNFPVLMSTRAFSYIHNTQKNMIRVYTFRCIHLQQHPLRTCILNPVERTVRSVYKCADKHFILSLVSRYSYLNLLKNDFTQTTFRLIE